MIDVSDQIRQFGRSLSALKVLAVNMPAKGHTNPKMRPCYE
jgi:hypothetical protein